jgi:hypothetical protein
VTSNAAATSASRENRKSTPYPFLFRRLHWLLTGSAIVLILTGFSLHAGSRPDWSLLDGKVPPWFWTGRAHYWHACIISLSRGIILPCKKPTGRGSRPP